MGNGERGTGRSRRGRAARGRGRPSQARGKGSLRGRAAASRCPVGGSPRGAAGVGPGGGDSQPPRLREDEAFSFLTPPLPPLRGIADGARDALSP